MLFEIREWPNVRADSTCITSVVRDLAIVVAKDYERRKKKERPDRWHWADELLLSMGYTVAPLPVTHDRERSDAPHGAFHV